MFPRLLLPLDGSPTAAQALPFAMTLAHALDSEVQLLSVVEPLPTWSGHSSAAKEAAEQAHTLATAYLEQVTAELQRDGITATGIVQQGHPAHVILAAAVELDSSLIVLASHGHSGLARLRLGSVAQQVVRHALIPTLVVRARAAGGMEGATIGAITVTLDGSAEAEQALPVATSLADALAVPLTLLTVLPNFIGAYPWVTYLPTPEQDQADEEAAQAYLAATLEKLRTPGRQVRAIWLRGLTNRVEQTISDYLADQPRGLVVMARHGRSGVKRWVLGSTAEAVLAQAPGSVLIVPVNPGEELGPRFRS
jgi:nucleotide-binding universal stress UspA family protein